MRKLCEIYIGIINPDRRTPCDMPILLCNTHVVIDEMRTVIRRRKDNFIKAFAIVESEFKKCLFRIKEMSGRKTITKITTLLFTIDCAKSS